MKRQIVTLNIGDTEHRLIKYNGQDDGLFLLRIHGNETDAKAVAHQWVEQRGGCFLDVDNHSREINFEINGEKFLFDPNRVFSQEGIKKTLHDYECRYSADVVDEVKKFANAMKAECDSNRCIIALHNNEDFNINFYAPQGEYAGAASDIYVNEKHNPHNLVIVTNPEDFSALKQNSVNVILEKPKGNNHSGSFSEHCASNDIRYFNIETEFGEINQQQELLQIVAKVIANPRGRHPAT